MAPGKPLKESKVKQMKQEFLNLDADGDGNISVAELRKVLFSMMGKLKVSEAEINQVLKDIDKDGDGTIDFKEFMVVLYTISKGTPKEKLGNIYRYVWPHV